MHQTADVCSHCHACYVQSALFTSSHTVEINSWNVPRIVWSFRCFFLKNHMPFLRRHSWGRSDHSLWPDGQVLSSPWCSSLELQPSSGSLSHLCGSVPLVFPSEPKKLKAVDKDLTANLLQHSTGNLALQVTSGHLWATLQILQDSFQCQWQHSQSALRSTGRICLVASDKSVMALKQHMQRES